MITPITPADRGRWAELWTAHLACHRTSVPPETYDATWDRIMAGGPIHGLAWRQDGRLTGLVHYLFHDHAWSPHPACYLQDLYVRPAARRAGAGRALIAAVADAARARGATRLYWLTQEDNPTGRALSDQIANRTGSIRYDYPL